LGDYQKKSSVGAGNGLFDVGRGVTATKPDPLGARGEGPGRGRYYGGEGKDGGFLATLTFAWIIFSSLTCDGSKNILAGSGGEKKPYKGG